MNVAVTQPLAETPRQQAQSAGEAKPARRARLAAVLIALFVAQLAWDGAWVTGISTQDPSQVVRLLNFSLQEVYARSQRLANDVSLFYQLVGGKKLLPAAAQGMAPTIRVARKPELCKEASAAWKALPQRTPFRARS